MWISLGIGIAFILFGYWNWKNPAEAWKANVARFHHYDQQPTAKDEHRQKLVGIFIVAIGVIFLLLAGWSGIQHYILR
jgi:sterol desaturase/sphingolipid hydroxylase (fatty acid hydroxylase superfamily)